ncbi:MAG TPA: ABC transporter substrate-binding protein [Polaromonas sp.]|jgi:ABC-type branched-subunit amino acid transport system substrate-binding protein|uniref:ABC transporter substrate-binding protein n=1 Tax=unclassified Polaromonas TaxID=2638319 RepID=UPI000BC94F59|nr:MULTISPECIES: ABC transporter substrate-binding protein [unclassified Polaromonas]OYY33000.1 MAG: ABC transporter permease [Polaromonas sp. 35-63-35]OYZ17179.1 MAG: ABC transporter permease [Polaromonas sp. 16-63-31]OYZ76433.1 MAG: ABC transporter permease [Polaromonas sp. 24-63-21]OZA47625.1 MAG: ABC transporter permease [Polaromonas sp. 17-63-33]OZA85703.1 MAG: ABC transporter permease [Polaromonas sp. 39-63-25]
MNFFQRWGACSLLALLLSAPGHAADIGVTDKEILVGQFAAQTGPAAELGKRMQLGMLAYFNAVNAAGGINGRTIKLVSRDDGYEPEKAAAAVKALIEEDKVFALVGSVGTPTTLAAVPAINAAGIPLIGPFTGAQALREPLNRNLFHVRASYFDETERIVQHLSTLGIKKIAVFYQNDSYGKAGLEGVTRALTKRSLKPAAAVTVERNSVDVSAAWAELVKAAPEAVVQISAYKSCAALIKLARSKGYGGQFFNVSFVGSTALSAELGDAGAGVTISQVVPFPYTPSSEIVREYQQRMTEAGNKDFDFSSMEGFLAAKVFVEGVRRAGKALTRASLVSGLESMRDVNMGGFLVSYSPKNHEASHYTDLTIIGRGGRFVR